MTLAQQIITIGLCAVGTMLTRFLPFAIFSRKKSTPKYIRYLGNALPGAIFGLLVVYCLKEIDFTVKSYGIPELLSVGLTAALHIWKKNMFLSIAGGTACYMLLVNFVF
jgi:branched-subunit amino acid transport protein AzlD